VVILLLSSAVEKGERGLRKSLVKVHSMRSGADTVPLISCIEGREREGGFVEWAPVNICLHFKSPEVYIHKKSNKTEVKFGLVRIDYTRLSQLGSGSTSLGQVRLILLLVSYERLS